MQSTKFRRMAAVLMAVAMNSFVAAAATPRSVPGSSAASAHVVAQNAAGGGFFGDGALCTVCVFGGLFAVWSGGVAYAYLAANASLASGAVAGCVAACASAWAEE